VLLRQPEEEPDEKTVQRQFMQRQMLEEEESEEEPVQPKFIQRQVEGEEKEGLLQARAEDSLLQRQSIEEEEEPPASTVQTKLTIGEPNDRYEKEADGVAERVMRMAEPEQEGAGPITPLVGSQVQTACEDCESEERIQTKTTFPAIPDATKAPPQAAPETVSGPAALKGAGAPPAAGEKEAGKAGKEGKDGKGQEAAPKIELPDVEPYVPEKEEPPIQTKRESPAKSSAEAWLRRSPEASDVSAASARSAAQSQGPAAIQDTLQGSKGGGNPLSPAVRSDMEGRFGTDLGQVCVHTDSDSIQMNRDLHARAFTHKNDIYFNAGEYAPSSPAGRFLLAHELTHTVQQGAVGDRVQRYSAPEQDVSVEPKPARPDDGGEVTGRMNEKITNDENVQNQEDLSDEEREEKKKPNRGEVRQESGEIKTSGEAKPSIDRGAQAEEKTTAQKGQLQQELQQQPPEATEKEEGKREKKAPLTPAQAAAQRAQAAQAQAYAVPIPAEPQPFRHPRIKAPIDSTGEPLPGNAQIDTQVRGLGYIGEMLREKGYEVKRHAARQEMGSYGLDSVLEREREELARAREGTVTMEAHNQARQEIANQSREAHSESVQRQQFVAEKAPDLAGKADEGGADSGELAAEARGKADQSQSEIPDDEDARGDAEQQSGELQDTAQGAASMDQAIRQSGERARQYAADAEAAAEQNEQSEARITETDEVIAQTQARITEMQATNEASQAKIDNASGGPALIRQFAQRDAESGDELIAATIVMEEELNALQEKYLSDMAQIESREESIKRQQKEQEESGKGELSPEERQLFELAGMNEAEQEQHVAGMSQTQRSGLLATLERMIQTTPDQGTDVTEGARLKVDTGLGKAISGEPPPDPRAEQIQEVENHRIERVGGALDLADRNMNLLTEEQQRMLANRLVADSITDGIKKINVLQMGEAMLKGMIDPRQSLTGVVGGFEKMLTGFANIGNWDAWRKDPLGNLLQIAADITTGLATIFSSILGLAALITAVMVALTIISWGFLSPVTGPVIAWMGTIITYAGWGAIITGGLAVYFNYLAYLKNLHDAGTAQTARELFGNSEQMKQNATDGFQSAMAVVEGVGAVKMGPKLSSGEFFGQVPRSPGAFVRQTAQGIKRGVASLASAPGRLGRGIRDLFAGGKQGLVRFKERIQGLFGRRRPGRPGEIDLPDTPEARQRHQRNLDEARGKPVHEMDASQLQSEVREAGKNRPKRVEPGSEHYRDYDVEIKSGEHSYRRRRDGRGWCRFTDKVCFVDLPPGTRRALGIDENFGDDLFDDYLVSDPDLERAASRRARAEPGGRQAQQEALSDIRKTGETPLSPLREGIDPKRRLYMGETPGKRSLTGEKVIARMRAETPPRVSGITPNEQVFVVGPDGVHRWYPIGETEMGHISPKDAVIYWNNTGRHLGPKHPQVRKWMRDPVNYELEHNVVNARKGAILGQTEEYLPPTTK
jgi:hypothetical protein